MEQVYKQWKKKKNEKKLVVLEYIKLDIMMIVVYCYLEREYDKVLKFQMNNFPFFEISASLF